MRQFDAPEVQKIERCFGRVAWVLTLTLAVLTVPATGFAKDDLAQPIRVSPDGHYLMQSNGEPFFWLGDWAWELFKTPTRDDVDKYLKDRANKGFTLILAPATGDFAPLSRTNPYGQTPFLKNDGEHPNPRYFENVDWIIERAAHYGLRFALLPSWGNLVTGDVEDKIPQILTSATAESYGRWLGSRYRNKGILWVLGGDTNPIMPKSVRIRVDAQGKWMIDRGASDLSMVDYRPVYDALARGILEGDSPSAFITYHPTVGTYSGVAQPRTSLYFGDRSWLQMNMLQSGHTVNAAMYSRFGLDFGWVATFNYEPVTAEYYSNPIRPVIDGETRFEDLAIDIEKGRGYWKAYDSRNGAYHALFAGAAGHNYGNESLGLFYDPVRNPVPLELEWKPWQEALNSPGSAQMQHVKALMLSRPYFTRIPDQSLVLGDQGQGDAHISATRDKDGSYAMIYLPKGQAVTADLSKISGSMAAGWWFDPRTGSATKIDEIFPTAGAKTFRSPSSGPEDDWILVIDNAQRSFQAPGKSN